MDSDEGVTKRGRGRRKGTTTRGASTPRARGRGRGRGRGRKTSRVIESDDEGSPEQQTNDELDASNEEKPIEQTLPETSEEKENEIHPPASKNLNNLNEFVSLNNHPKLIEFIFQLIWKLTYHSWKRQHSQRLVEDRLNRCYA